MDLSDLEFWSFLAVAVPILLMPVGIAWWKGSRIGPVALLSLVFWPGALILALRLRSHRLRGPRKPRDQSAISRGDGEVPPPFP